MKKQSNLTAYLLIVIGAYFLLEQFNLPFLSDFSAWPTLIILIGIAFLLNSFTTKDYGNLFSGILILGLGVHFHGLNTYPNWIEHWAVYPFIIGIAYLIRFFKTKNGLIPGLLLVGFSSIMIFSITMPSWFNFVYYISDLLERFWPIAIIILGVYILKKK